MSDNTEQNAHLHDVPSYSVINYLPVVLFLFNLNPDGISVIILLCIAAVVLVIEKMQ